MAVEGFMGDGAASSVFQVNALQCGEEMPQVESIPAGGCGELTVENGSLCLEGALVQSGGTDLACSRKLFLNELAEVIGTALRKEREIYEAGANRRFNDLHRFLMHEFSLRL